MEVGIVDSAIISSIRAGPRVWSVYPSLIVKLSKSGEIFWESFGSDRTNHHLGLCDFKFVWILFHIWISNCRDSRSHSKIQVHRITIPKKAKEFCVGVTKRTWYATNRKYLHSCLNDCDQRQKILEHSFCWIHLVDYHQFFRRVAMHILEFQL